MLKKLTCLLLVCFTLSTYVYASDTQSDADTVENKVYTLSLQDAIMLAVSQNPELQVCDIKLSSLNVSLDAARLSRKSIKDSTISISSGLTSAYVKDGYYVDMYESQIRLGKLEKEKIQNKIAYNVTEKYFNYKLTERLIRTTEQSYSLALENKNTTDERFKLGLVSQIEVDNAAVALEQSRVAVDNYKRSFDIAKEDLKIALQLDDEDCSFVLTDDIDFADFESDVDADVAAALETRYDTVALREAAALEKRYFEITSKYTAPNTATYNSAHSDYIQSDYNMTNNTKQIALSIRSDYNNVLSSKDSLKIAEQNLAIKKQEFSAASLRHEMGMMTNMQLTSVLNDLAQYEINVENAKLKYKLAVIKYQYNTTIGL